jgi:adenosylhomocysteine nucleosidase
MKIAIIGAMQKEIDFLLERIEQKKTKNCLNHLFYEGVYQDKELVIVKAGIGKVASGLLFSALVHTYPDLDLAINVGVSGGIAGSVDIGAVVAGTRLSYLDVDTTVDGENCFGQVPGCPQFFLSGQLILEKIKDLPLKRGVILTGDRFITDAVSLKMVIEAHFPEEDVLAVDMESAALAQGAWFYGVPYLALRVISDLIGRETQYAEYERNLAEACKNSNLMLLEVLKRL